jgi:hypothetical protein
VSDWAIASMTLVRWPGDGVGLVIGNYEPAHG